MTRFEQDRADKLKRMRTLRTANALGMIAWREDSFGYAEQKIRMLHPLSWIWTSIVILAGVVIYGMVDVWREAKALRSEMVWW
jgi:hypothetical protein